MQPHQRLISSSSRKVVAGLMLLLVAAVGSGSAQTCRAATLIRTGVTAEDRSSILETHNRLRSQVAQGTVPNQPSAQNMQEMVWDEELAYKAQQWANQCTFEHDPGRYLDRFTMGQNLATIWSTIPLADDDGDFRSRIQNWFNEVQKYAWGAQWSAATGHYSQLVWGDTNLIGCGFSYYKDARRFNKLWVCNYGPGGNVEGSQPYEVGHPACSNFGMHASSRYSGLCYNYGQTASGNQNYNNNDNYITNTNTFTFKSETFNPPTFQLHSQPAAPVVQPPPQPQQPLQSVFKPIVQAVVQPVNNFVQDYSFKSIFDRFKGVLNLQRVSPTNENKPSSNYNFDYQQPDQTNQYSNYQPPQQPSNDYQQTPSGYGNQQQQNYQVQPQNNYHDYYQQQQQPQQPEPSYPVTASGGYQTPQQQPSHNYNEAQQNYQPSYQHQQYYQHQQQQQNNRNNPFLTYDWSQLFNHNSDNQNNG